MQDSDVGQWQATQFAHYIVKSQPTNPFLDETSVMTQVVSAIIELGMLLEISGKSDQKLAYKQYVDWLNSDKFPYHDSPLKLGHFTSPRCFAMYKEFLNQKRKAGTVQKQDTDYGKDANITF